MLFVRRPPPFRTAATPCSWSATASRSARVRTCERRWPGCRSTSTPRRGGRAAQGVRVLARAAGAADGVIVFPLGTNDSPSNPDGLAAEPRGGPASSPATAAWWWRRSRGRALRGVSVAGLNRVVEQFAGQTGAQVADWRTGGRERSRACSAATGARDRRGLRGCGRACSPRRCRAACSAAGPRGIPAPRNPDARPPPRAAAAPSRRAASRSPLPRSRLASWSARSSVLRGRGARGAHGCEQGGPGAGAGRSVTAAATLSDLDVGVVLGEVLGERFPHLLSFARAGQAVAAQQLLLALERQPGDLPADGEPLEEELHAALPAVLGGGGRLGVEVAQRAQRARAQLVAQREDVALLVAVVGGRGGGALRPPSPGVGCGCPCAAKTTLRPRGDRGPVRSAAACRSRRGRIAARRRSALAIGLAYLAARAAAGRPRGPRLPRGAVRPRGLHDLERAVVRRAPHAGVQRAHAARCRGCSARGSCWWLPASRSPRCSSGSSASTSAPSAPRFGALWLGAGHGHAARHEPAPVRGRHRPRPRPRLCLQRERPRAALRVRLPEPAREPGGGSVHRPGRTGLRRRARRAPRGGRCDRGRGARAAGPARRRVPGGRLGAVSRSRPTCRSRSSAPPVCSCCPATSACCAPGRSSTRSARRWPWSIETQIGGTAPRLGMLFGGPLLLCATRDRLRRPGPQLAALALAGLRAARATGSGPPRSATSTRRCGIRPPRPPTSSRCASSSTRCPTSAASRSRSPAAAGRTPRSRRSCRWPAAGCASSTPVTTRSSTAATSTA